MDDWKDHCYEVQELARDCDYSHDANDDLSQNNVDYSDFDPIDNFERNRHVLDIAYHQDGLEKIETDSLVVELGVLVKELIHNKSIMRKKRRNIQG